MIKVRTPVRLNIGQRVIVRSNYIKDDVEGFVFGTGHDPEGNVAWISTNPPSFDALEDWEFVREL